jgi:hypothetical protein
MLSRPMSPLPSIILYPLEPSSIPPLTLTGKGLPALQSRFSCATMRSFASRQRRKPGGSIVNSGNLVRFGTVGIFGSLQVTGGQGAGA